jgi:hypothetical protein
MGVMCACLEFMWCMRHVFVVLSCYISNDLEMFFWVKELQRN